MEIVIFYKEEEQRIAGDVRMFLLACDKSADIPWKTGKDVIGIALFQGEVLIKLQPVKFTWRSPVTFEVAYAGKL